MQCPAARVARSWKRRRGQDCRIGLRKRSPSAPPGCFCCCLQRNISQRSTSVRHPAPTIGASWSDMKREHYGNFSVADMAINSRKAAKGNAVLPFVPSARPGTGAREPNLAARTSRIGIGRWHPLAFGFHLSAETLVLLRFRLIGLGCVVLLISLALAGMAAYSNASRSVRTEMRAAFLVGRQTVESAIDRLQNARDA